MTPLADRLRTSIRQNGPQRVDHLRRELRRRGHNLPADLIERELRTHTQLFRPTGTGSWDLAEHVAAPEVPSPDHNTARTDPMIAGALVDSFVVVDVETTGTDPDVVVRGGGAPARLADHVAALMASGQLVEVKPT